jgi:hypothetical protein
MPMKSTSQPSMIQRIECALVLLAYFIELDGDVYVPMYEKFEAELQELKRKEKTEQRAQRRLMSYRENSKNDSLNINSQRFRDIPYHLLASREFLMEY